MKFYSIYRAVKQHTGKLWSGWKSERRQHKTENRCPIDIMILWFVLCCFTSLYCICSLSNGARAHVWVSRPPKHSMYLWMHANDVKINKCSCIKTHDNTNFKCISWGVVVFRFLFLFLGISIVFRLFWIFLNYFASFWILIIPAALIRCDR